MKMYVSLTPVTHRDRPCVVYMPLLGKITMKWLSGLIGQM